MFLWALQGVIDSFFPYHSPPSIASMSRSREVVYGQYFHCVAFGVIEIIAANVTMRNGSYSLSVSPTLTRA